MFWFFSGKKEVEKIKEETHKGFISVKNDINSISEWIKHLDVEKNKQRIETEEIKDILSTMQEDLENLKNVFQMMNEFKPKQSFKTSQQSLQKQTSVYAVQTGVQTGVQTPNLEQFSITERAIIWVLLNTDMNLSYEDLAVMLGKEKTTIRGQINSIKQKSEGLIQEIIEKNGKKRLYIPQDIREKLVKKPKVSVNKQKNKKK